MFKKGEIVETKDVYLNDWQETFSKYFEIPVESVKQATNYALRIFPRLNDEKFREIVNVKCFFSKEHLCVKIDPDKAPLGLLLIFLKSIRTSPDYNFFKKVILKNDYILAKTMFDTIHLKESSTYFCFLIDEYYQDKQRTLCFVNYVDVAKFIIMFAGKEIRELFFEKFPGPMDLTN